MSLLLTDDVSASALARFDLVIDVRSPGEFALDHLPGAVNLPVLTDAERAEVGTIYVQESRFKARRVGAAYVAQNVGRHLREALAERPGGFAPLIYCWRGGMRSNAMATILSQVGWRTTVLQGGYMTYRREVTARLYDGELDLDFVLLDGHTAPARPNCWPSSRNGGDLTSRRWPAIAARCSARFRCPQPSQKLSRAGCWPPTFDPTRPVVAEAEASKIGDRMLPPALWTRFAQAPAIELAAERADRARYLVSAYAELTADRAALDAAFARLPVHPSRQRLAGWRALADAGAFAELAEALRALHYDPA